MTKPWQPFSQRALKKLRSSQLCAVTWFLKHHHVWETQFLKSGLGIRETWFLLPGERRLLGHVCCICNQVSNWLFTCIACNCMATTWHRKLLPRQQGGRIKGKTNCTEHFMLMSVIIPRKVRQELELTPNNRSKPTWIDFHHWTVDVCKI